MLKNVRKTLWSVTIVIHLIMLSLIGAAYRVQIGSLGNYRSTATIVAQHATETSQYLTNPPPSSTPPPTYTLIPSPTITPTLVPCVLQSSTSARVYQQPSLGRTKDSVSVPEMRLPLFGRIQNENWYFTQTTLDDKTIQGWVYGNDLNNAEKCADLRTVNLDFMLIPWQIKPDVIATDTFSSFEYEWRTSDNSTPEKIFEDSAHKQKVRAGNGPVYFQLLNHAITGSSVIALSFNRQDFSTTSYVGIKLQPMSDPDKAIELRVAQDQCRTTWLVQDKQYTTPLGSGANCNDNVEDFLFLRFNNKDGSVNLEGAYNDANLPELTLSDMGDAFNTVNFSLVVFYGEVKLNYVLISKIP